MRIPAIPGPRDVTTALTTLVPRLTGLLAGAESLLRRADLVLDDIAALVDRAEATRADVAAVVLRADAAIARVESTRLDAVEVVLRYDAAVGRIEATRTDAAEMVARYDATAARAEALVDRLEPPVVALLPVLYQLTVTATPARVAAAGPLLDAVPGLLDRLRRLDPVLRGLETVGPDIRDLLEASHELNEMLAHLPGMGRVRRKVEEEQAEEERAEEEPTS